MASQTVASLRRLRRARDRGDWPGLYVGGRAAPAITTAATLRALRDDPFLRAIVAPRLRDLADALVDLPWAILRGRAPRDVSAPLTVLTERSDQLDAFAADYAAGA